MTPVTAYSLIQRLARLVPAPRRPGADRSTAATEVGREHFGRCPACGEFIGVTTATADETLVCPACRQRIEGVDPLFAPGDAATQANRR